MILVRRDAGPVWVPAIFVKWMYHFSGWFFYLDKYYYQALEKDNSRWP